MLFFSFVTGAWLPSFLHLWSSLAPDSSSMLPDIRWCCKSMFQLVLALSSLRFTKKPPGSSLSLSVINSRHSSWGLSLQVLLDGNGR